MKQRSRKKQNNAGMSLVEIVVVVLILGILSAGTTMGFTYIRSMDASSAAEEITSLLERTRLNTLSAEEGSDVKLELKKDGDSYYGIISQGGTELEKMAVGGNGLAISVTDAGGAETVVDGTPVEFTYHKSNGAFRSSYTKIEITGSKTVTVTLVTATGRCYIGN